MSPRGGKRSNQTGRPRKPGARTGKFMRLGPFDILVRMEPTVWLDYQTTLLALQQSQSTMPSIFTDALIAELEKRMPELEHDPIRAVQHG